MIDPSILIQNAKLNKSGASGSTTNGNDNLLNQNSGFSNIFDKQIENVKTTSSGIESPENNNLLAKENPEHPISSRSIEGSKESILEQLIGHEEDNIEKLMIHPEMGNVEKSINTLGDGLKIILLGDKPSEESLIEYAKSQGVNIAALETSILNKSQNLNVAQSQNALKQSIDVQSQNTLKQNIDVQKTQIKNVDVINNIKNTLKLAMENQEAKVEKLPINLSKTQMTFLAQLSQYYKARDSGNNLVKKDITTLNETALHNATSRTDSSIRHGILATQDLTTSDIERRHEQYLEISRRLTESLGNRIVTQIRKGAWRVEMDLHPKSLGRIEIQLEMKNGELEAYFNTSQNVTRDLLQESFVKLKSILSQHGIDSAYVGLGKENKRSSDENLTDKENYTTDQEESNKESKNRSKDNRTLDGRLDIKV